MELDTKVGRMFGEFGMDSLQELEKLLGEYQMDGVISGNITIPMILKSGYPIQKMLAQENN